MLFLLGDSLSVFAVLPIDTVANRLATQLSVYPQEKLYIHTDKPLVKRIDIILPVNSVLYGMCA